MGTNTDAILFYGFHHPDGEGWEEILGDDWEDKLAEASGVVEPTSEFTDVTRQEHMAYWTKKQEICTAEPCEVDDHCSGDYPMQFVCVKESKTKASRGYPEEIKALVESPRWYGELRAFAEKMGIPWQEPKWWLVSWWSH